MLEQVNWGKGGNSEMAGQTMDCKAVEIYINININMIFEYS